MPELTQAISAALAAIGEGEPRAMAGLLVLCSILLHLLASNLAWYYRVSPRSPLSSRIRELALTPYSAVLLQLLRLTYYLVFPGAALVLGWVDLRSLGLGYLDWADGARWFIVLALASWSLLMFVWVPFIRAAATVPEAVPPHPPGPAQRVVEVIYMQSHWAFYRAAAIVLLGSFLVEKQAFYWGTAVGFFLILCEAWADPRVRQQIAHLGEGELSLWSAGQAVLNAVGFVLMRNLWLLGLLHLTLEFTVPHLRSSPREKKTTPSPTTQIVIQPEKEQGAP